MVAARIPDMITPATIGGRSFPQTMMKMFSAPEEERSARFVCAMAAVLSDGMVLCEKGIMEGKIAYSIEGTNGFGYDPIFYLDEFGCSSAALSREQKNEISHRGKALRLMKEKLKEVL